VLDEFPDDVGAHNDLGYLYADQNKRPERALRMTQKAVAAEPKNSAYRDSLGWAYFRLGRFNEAVAELKHALTLEDATDGVLFDHLGDALSKTGDAAGAKDAYQKARQSTRLKNKVTLQRWKR
jgi:predicted Zn-dependent protease